MLVMQKPEGLTTFGQLNLDYRNKPINKNLTPIRDGQFDPALGGQGHWFLHITPPQALRPYFQEGFLVGTDDITNEYEYKGELDLNNRLIAKFEIPNNDSFWGKDFDRIPENAIYPKNDRIEEICKEIELELRSEIAPANLGTFLQLWTELEQEILRKARKHKREVHNVRNALNVLMTNEDEQYGLLKEFDYMRMFRNNVVHKPTTISNQELIRNIEILKQLIKEIK